MATFSPSDAALEGFRTIGRHWRVVAGWGVFNLLAVVAMIVVMVVVSVPVVLATGGAASASPIVGMTSVAVWLVGYVLVKIILLTGLYRLLLRPQEEGFLHLRLGRPELRVLVIVLIFAVAAAAVGSAVVAMLQAWAVAGWIAGPLGVVVLFVLFQRLGLTPVISFAEGGMPFAEAWRRTRGVTWRLIGMSLLLYCLLAVIGVVLWIALFATGGALTGFGDANLSGAESFAAHPGRYLFQVAAEMLLEPLFIIVLQAPWVAVYKALTPETAAAEVFA
jgi:hypothetical protein